MAVKTAERPRPTAVAHRPGTQVGIPARAERMEADAGKGGSTNRDDKIVPMIRVLQAQSPQCLKQKPEYVKGAEAGDFFLKNTLTPIVKGEVGLEFQWCAFARCWLEFDGPRGDSPKFVGRLEDDNNRPRVAPGVEVKLDEDDGYDYVDKSGHRYTFSREHYGLVGGRPFVLPFGGSGHTTSREWSTLADQFQLPSGKPEPKWNRKWLIRTVPKSNASGDWFGIQFEPVPGEVTDEEYARGLAFYNAVVGGVAVAEAPEPDPNRHAEGTM